MPERRHETRNAYNPRIRRYTGIRNLAGVRRISSYPHYEITSAFRSHRKHPADFSEWLARTPGIIAALTALLALFFVVLNAGYVNFYETLGITPEAVGIDKAAVLARTAGIIPIAYTLGWITWIVCTNIPLEKHPRILLTIEIFLGVAAFFYSSWFYVALCLILLLYSTRLAWVKRQDFKRPSSL